MAIDTTRRFSNRVDDYILYRPGYPVEIIDFLNKNCGLTSSSIIADIGSGTGKSSEIFLNNGNIVYGIEPNDEMREAAEAIFKKSGKFISINAKAEATGLNDHFFDFIIAGQAFHWFNYEIAKKEFNKILKPGGFVVLIWNERPVNQSGFMGDYDKFLINHSTDYSEIDHRNIDEKILRTFYHPQTYSIKEFRNEQIFDFAGLKGRYDSCSYAIPENDEAYKGTMEALHILFDIYQQNGTIVMDYITKLYWGNF